jgi:hypothetical protein
MTWGFTLRQGGKLKGWWVSSDKLSLMKENVRNWTWSTGVLHNARTFLQYCDMFDVQFHNYFDLQTGWKRHKEKTACHDPINCCYNMVSVADEQKMTTKHWQNDTDMANWSTWTNICPSASASTTFYTNRPTWTGVGLNMALCHFGPSNIKHWWFWVATGTAFSARVPNVNKHGDRNFLLLKQLGGHLLW